MKFVNTEINIENEVQLSNIKNSGAAMSATALSDNKVCIVHTQQQDTSNLYSIYYTICTIEDDGTISIENMQLIDSNNYETKIFVFKISNNRLIVCYLKSPTNTSVKNFYYKIFNIHTDTNTLEVTMQGTNFSSSRIYFSAILLEEDKIALFYESINLKLMSTILKINTDNTVNFTEKIIDETHYSGNSIKSCMLTENKIAVLHNSGGTSSGSNWMKLKICTVENESISVVSNTELKTKDYKNLIIIAATSIVTLSKNKILITADIYKSSSEQENSIYVFVYQITENSVTLKNETLLDRNSSGYSFYTNILKQDKNNIAIIYVKSSNLYIGICKIIKENIIIENNIKLSNMSVYSNCISSLNVKNKIITMFGNTHNSVSRTLNSVLYSISEDTVAKVENYDDIITGIAKTSGTEGQLVDVAVPETEEEQ